MIYWTPSINQDKTFLLLSSSLLKWMCQSNWHLVVYYSWNIDLPKVYRIEGDAQHGNGAIFFYFNINNLKPVVISFSFTPIRSAVYCCVFGVARLDNLCISSLIGLCTLRRGTEKWRNRLACAPTCILNTLDLPHTTTHIACPNLEQFMSTDFPRFHFIHVVSHNLFPISFNWHTGTDQWCKYACCKGEWWSLSVESVFSSSHLACFIN